MYTSESTSLEVIFRASASKTSRFHFLLRVFSALILFLPPISPGIVPPVCRRAGTCVLSPLSVEAAAAAVLLALNLFGNFLARARFHFSIRHQGSTSSVRRVRHGDDGGDESGIVNGVGVPPPLRPRPSVSVRPSVRRRGDFASK